MRNLPDWVLKYKTKGTNVILKNGKYSVKIIFTFLSYVIAYLNN